MMTIVYGGGKSLCLATKRRPACSRSVIGRSGTRRPWAGPLHEGVVGGSKLCVDNRRPRWLQSVTMPLGALALFPARPAA